MSDESTTSFILGHLVEEPANRWPVPDRPDVWWGGDEGFFLRDEVARWTFENTSGYLIEPLSVEGHQWPSPNISFKSVVDAVAFQLRWG